jgi:hypothetical protein
MGDEKKRKSGGGTLRKLILLVVVLLVGAEVMARLTSQYEWSPVTRVRQLLKGAP